MINEKIVSGLDSLKNVECPYCGYQLPLIYDEDTVVKNLLVSCKGRQCKKHFILNIQNGEQVSGYISRETVEAYKKVFGEDCLEHLRDKYGKDINFPMNWLF